MTVIHPLKEKKHTYLTEKYHAVVFNISNYEMICKKQTKRTSLLSRTWGPRRHEEGSKLAWTKI